MRRKDIVNNANVLLRYGLGQLKIDYYGNV